MSESCWKLDGTVARLAFGGAGAEIDLTRPKNGLALKFLTPPGAAVWHVLGVDFDADPTDGARLDAYVRGNDLVATFDEAAPRKVRAQIYWRCLKASDFSPEYARHVAAAFDLIVSVNTSLLDSDPQSNVRSIVFSADKLLGIIQSGSSSRDLSAQELQSGSASVDDLRGFIVRPAEGKFSYAEIVHPAESCRSEAKWATPPESDRSPAVEITQHLFQQRLEKGVILRGWIRAALVARDHDEAAVLAAYQHFVAAEPPLTV